MTASTRTFLSKIYTTSHACSVWCFAFQAGAPPPSSSSQINRTISRQPRTSVSATGSGGVLDRRRSNSGAGAVNAAGTTSFSHEPERRRRSGTSGGGTGVGLPSSFDEPEDKSSSNPEPEGTHGLEPDQTKGAVAVGRDNSLRRSEEAISIPPESLVPSPTASAAVDQKNAKRAEEGLGRAQVESIAAAFPPDTDDSSKIAVPRNKDSEAEADAPVDVELHGEILVRRKQRSTDDGNTWTTDDVVIMRGDANTTTSAAAAVPSLASSANSGDGVPCDPAANEEQNDFLDDTGDPGTAMFQPVDPAEGAPRDTDDLDIRLGRANMSAAARGFVTSNQAGQGNDEGYAGGDGGWGDMAYLGDMDEEELAAESEKLRRESHRAQRDAETVTDEMKEEVRFVMQGDKDGVECGDRMMEWKGNAENILS